jgi:hypothetical protein
MPLQVESRNCVKVIKTFYEVTDAFEGTYLQLKQMPFNLHLIRNVIES